MYHNQIEFKGSFYYHCQKKDQVKDTMLSNVFCGWEQAVDVDREKDKDCKQLVHMADSHMTCKQCGLALRRRKNNMTFLAHKLLHCLSEGKLIILNTIHYKSSQDISRNMIRSFKGNTGFCATPHLPVHNSQSHPTPDQTNKKQMQMNNLINYVNTSRVNC